jgi:hypothetical protein
MRPLYNLPVRKFNPVSRYGLILCLIASNLVVVVPQSSAAEKTELNTASVCTGAWGTTAGTFNGPANQVYAPYGVTITKATIPFNPINNGYNTSRLTFYVHNSGTGLPGSSLGTLSYSSVSGSIATLTGSVTLPSAGNYWVQYNTPTGGYYNCYTNTINYSGSASGWTVIRGMIYGTAGSGSAATAWANWGGQYGFQMNYTLYSNEVAPDTTPPTFTSSSSFSAAENIATSATAATIQVSESATVTISSGADAARFNITRTETNTAVIKFNASPNFEAPADVGGNNVYDITLTATDTANNAGTQSITITVTDVVDTSSFNSLALAGSVTTATFRSSIVVTANVSVSSKVTFIVNGKVLPGCKGKSTTGSGSSHSVTCNWKPSNRGTVSLSASAAPTGAGITGATASPVSIVVERRTGAR